MSLNPHAKSETEHGRKSIIKRDALLQLPNRLSGGCVIGELVLALLVTQLQAAAFEFEASGTIEKVDIEISKARQQLATKGGIQLPSVSSFSFRVNVRDCKWRIRPSPKDVTDVRNNIALTEAGSDGLYTYIVMYPGREVMRGATPGKHIPTNAVAQTFDGPVLFGIDTASIVWLAFCSGCYLGTVTNSNIIPIHLMRPPGVVEPKAFHKRASWELLSSKVKIPSQLQYFYDAFVRVGSDGKVETLKLAPPFDKGYVMASYKAISLTNTSDYKFPLEFRFETFRPDYERAKDAPETKSTRIWSGTVTDFSNLNLLSDSEHVPVLPGQTPIADWRLADEGLELVGHKTTVWPQLDEVRKSRSLGVWKAESQARNKSTKQKSSDSARKTIIFLLIVVSLIPLVWVCYTRMKTNAARA